MKQLFFFLFLSSLLQYTLCFTQAGYFISDLETNTESKFAKEIENWTSSVTTTPTSKYYNCAGDFLLGGYSWSPSITQKGQYLSRQYTELPVHKFVVYSFTFYVLDSWDWKSTGARDSFQIQFDNLPVIEGYGIDYRLSTTYLCGASNYQDVPGIRVFGRIAHTALSLIIKFISRLDEGTNNESLGIRDLSLFFVDDDDLGADYICAYTGTSIVPQNQTVCTCAPGEYSSNIGCVSCSEKCASCYGSGADKCYECAEGYYFDGEKCSKCDSSCLHCTGSKYNQCTECYSGFALFNGVCISSSRCSSPFTMDSGPVECYSPCSLESYAAWNESCYPSCPGFGISDLTGICKSCKILNAQYLKATDDGHQYTFQLSPSSCNLDINTVRRYLKIAEDSSGSIGSFSFQITKTSANNYFINLVLDQSVLETTSLDLKLSHLKGSLIVPKTFLPNDLLKSIAALIPTVKTSFAVVLGGSLLGTLALGATASLWSIVNFQQFVGYFLFLNINYPYQTELFLSMLQVSFWDILPNPLAFLTESLSKDILAEDRVAVTPYDPPSKFVKYNVSSFFVENGGVIIAVNMLLLVLLGHIMLLQKHKALGKNFIIVKLREYFQWNLIARTFLENGIPLSLAVFLQFRVATFDKSYLIICFALAVLSLLYISVFTLFFTMKLVRNRDEDLKKQSIKEKYGTLYEGMTLKSQRFAKYYNVIILLRGICLVCLVTFLEANPLLQVIPLVFFNGGLVLYMLSQVTFKDKKLDFIIKLKEILIFLGEFSMLFLCFELKEEIYYQIFGYLIVGFLGVALFIEVIYMVILQICQIRELVKQIKYVVGVVIVTLKYCMKGKREMKVKVRPMHRLRTHEASISSEVSVISLA